MKTIKILPVIFLTAVFLVGFWYLSRNSPIIDTGPIITQGETAQAAISISFSDDEALSKTIELDDNSTAFSLLKTAAENEKLQLETVQYDFGIFVKSINGYESSAERAWIYFVNGKSGSVSADQATVTEGDLVEWKYISPNE